METLALIPARSKSKGIIDKNIINLNGRPLIQYTCQAAIESKKINRVILSTDSNKYAAICEKFNIEIPFLRPKELSIDSAPMLPVMRHAIDFLEAKEEYRPDSVILLSPTCPLRNSNHIDEAIEKFYVDKVDTLVSVVEVPHSMAPESIMIQKGSNIELYNKKEPVFHRQNKRKYFARNGPAILVINTNFMMKCEHFYEGSVSPFLMPDDVSIDIDDHSDLLAIKEFMTKEKNIDKA